MYIRGKQGSEINRRKCGFVILPMPINDNSQEFDLIVTSAHPKVVLSYGKYVTLNRNFLRLKYRKPFFTKKFLSVKYYKVVMCVLRHTHKKADFYI